MSERERKNEPDKKSVIKNSRAKKSEKKQKFVKKGFVISDSGRII
jgi:hypothetical protein